MDMSTAIEREAASTLPVYPQLPFVPVDSEGCHIITADGRRILDLYGGHAVAALGYKHPRLTAAVAEQTSNLVFQSNAVALDVRALAAEKLTSIAPANLTRAFFVNSGAEANENALRIAFLATGRSKVVAVEHGFHGRTAAAGAVTWKSRDSWYAFPSLPFEVEFIPRDDIDAAKNMIDSDTAAVIFEPVQGVAGAYDLDPAFVQVLRDESSKHGALLIADEVQTGMGRSGNYFAVQGLGIEPDVLTAAKSLGGGIPCGALLVSDPVAATVKTGQLGSTFGGCPIAAAAIVAVIETIEEETLLHNVRELESMVRQQCVGGAVTSVQGGGFLLGLVCDRPAVDVQKFLLQHDILTGTSADRHVLRLLPPLVLEKQHVAQLVSALRLMDD